MTARTHDVPDQGRRAPRAATPTDLLLEDGVIAEIGRGSAEPAPRSSTPTGWSRCPAWSTCTPTCASPAARTPRRSRPAPQAAALGGFTAVHAMANTDPVADTAGVVEQVWRLGREAGHCDVYPVGAVTVGLARRAARRARRDGRLGGPGAGLLRRRQVRLRRGADAPGAGVRQGVRRRRRPARPGAAADRGRPDERGRAVRRLGPAPAGRRSPRRRSSPATACSPRTSARGCTSATCRRPARSRSSAGPRARAGTSPPRSRPHHLLLTDELAATYDPIYKVNPPLRTAADVEALRAGLADGTIDVVATDHAPHPHEDKDCEWAAAAFGMLGLETALSVVQETMVDTGLLDWAGVADRMSTPAGPDRPGRRPRPAARGRRAGQPRALRPVGTPGGRPVRAGLAVAATRRTPDASCPARSSRRSCAAGPTVLDGKLAVSRRRRTELRCSSSRTAALPRRVVTAPPARRSARRCSPPA